MQVIAAPKNHHFWANLTWLDITSFHVKLLLANILRQFFRPLNENKGQKIAIINCEYLGDACFNWAETSWYVYLDHFKHISLKLNWKKNVEVVAHLTFNLGPHCATLWWKTMKNETKCFNRIILCKVCSNKTIQSSLISEDDENIVIILFLLFVKSMSVISPKWVIPWNCFTVRFSVSYVVSLLIWLISASYTWIVAVPVSSSRTRSSFTDFISFDVFSEQV